MPKDVAERIEKANLATIKYPADGKLMGDWKRGERIAQTGAASSSPTIRRTRPAATATPATNSRSRRSPSAPSGRACTTSASCAAHGEAIQKYTYGKIYNAQAYSACSNMPRFGHNGILTEQQIKDVTALLLDPGSPVNK